jgi:DNA-binding NtrC family response regulator
MDLCVLFVSQQGDDAAAVSRMLEAARIRCEHVTTCREARSRLSRNSYGAVLTEATLDDGNWKNVLSLTLDMGSAPPLIVTDRAADDRLWAEVLNLGCYDMLAQPFDDSEVVRILALACAQVPTRPVASAAPGLKVCSVAS